MGINIGPKESVKDGLLLFLDAANSASYPGSGTSWFDITPNRNSGSNSATLGGDNIPAYSNDYGGLIFVDNQSSGDFVPIGPTGYIYSSFDENLASGSTQLTFEMWIRFYSSGAAIQTIFTFGSRYYLAIRTTLSRIAFYPASEAGAGGFGCGFTASDFGKWYHLVLVINADGTLDSVANNKMYFNGVQQSLDS